MPTDREIAGSLDLPNLKALLAEATRRPWVKFHSEYGDDVIAIMKGKRPRKSGERWKEIVAWPGFDGADTPKRYRHADARLIVAAVNSLPQLIERVERLEGVLRGILDHYLQLANSGDAGFWDPEKEDEVIAARAALDGTEAA